MFLFLHSYIDFRAKKKIILELDALSQITEREMNFVWQSSTISMLMESDFTMWAVITRNLSFVKLNFVSSSKYVFD